MSKNSVSLFIESGTFYMIINNYVLKKKRNEYSSLIIPIS